MSKQLRFGKCKQCGTCCYACIYKQQDNKCSCYNNRPDWCYKDFPQSKEDLIKWNVQDICGFYFVKNGF